jgi:multiple sugar transport system substrate-binding protein
MKIKKMGAVLCLFAIACCVWAGGSGEKTSSKTITWWAPNFNNPRSAELAEKFMKENPGIKIDIQETVAQGLQDKILVAIQSGTTPDIIEGQLGWTVSYAATGQLLPLDEYISKSKIIDPKDFMPGAWAGIIYNGKVYSIPYRAESHAFIYNKGMYRAAGLDPNTPPKTWNDLIAYSQKLTKTGGAKPVYGIGICGGGEVGNMITMLMGLIWANGGDVLSSDYKRVTINEPPAVEAVKFYTDLLITYKVAPPSTLQNDGTAIRNLFIQESIAQFQQGSYALPAIHKENPNIELGFGLLPAPEGKKPASVLGGWGYMIPKAAKNKDAAWAFVEWMSLPDNMAYYTDTFPATYSALKNKKFENPEFKAFIDMTPYARLTPPVKGWVQMMTIIFKEVQSVMLGQKSAQKAMDDAAAQMAPLL